MKFSLNWDGYVSDELGLTMTLTTLTGYDEEKNPIFDTFTSTVSFFLKVIERLKKLPMGNPLNDFVSVSVDLKENLVHLSPTIIYSDSSREEIEKVTFKLSELMMIPDENLNELMSLWSAREYKKRMFPEGELLTLEEVKLRFPWITNCEDTDFDELSDMEVEVHILSEAAPPLLPPRNVLYFRRSVTSVQEIPDLIGYAHKRHALDQCHILDSDGKEMACIEFDSSLMTMFGREKYERGDVESWSRMLRDARFLLLSSWGDFPQTVIYEFRLQTVDAQCK